MSDAAGGFGGFGGSPPGGSGSGSGVPRGARVRGKPSPLLVTVASLVALVVVLVVVSQFWTEVLWYESVQAGQVMWTTIAVQVVLFVAGMVLVGALVASSLVIAHRMRPVYAPTTPQQEVLERYRQMIEPVRRLAVWLVPLLFGAFAGLAAAGQWQMALAFVNRQDFGKADPTFGLDIGFFVFSLPMLQFAVAFLTMAFVLGLLAAALMHYIDGGISIGPKGLSTTRAARIHLSVLAAALVLVRGVGYWLDRYALSVRHSDRITGLTYADQYAVLPTKTILAVAAVICAVLFLATIWTTSWRLPIIGVAMLLILSVVAGGIYPTLVQSFRVRPSEAALEGPFIQHNINATRDAYGLSSIQKTDYAAKTDVEPGQLRQDAATIPGVRIIDPLIVSPTFTQMQGLRQYYAFPDALDVDRYGLKNGQQDSVVAARELNLEGAPQRNWVNDHTVYTHGYGLVTARGNTRTDEGAPDFFTRDIPPKGELTPFEPRIYFGERTHEYSLVGGEKGAKPRELDYQAADGERYTTYSGIGGVKLDNFFKRAAYAIKYRELKFLLSEQVGDFTTILDRRTPRERVRAVAPWLTLDGNIYPTVVDGRIQWVVDGYTTSDRYPYSRLQSLDTATSDTVTARSQSVQQARGGQVNYIRNSVKATVDAYDGTVRLYTWDESDPILKAWSKAFPGVVQPMSKISGGLMSHLRYPEDMFKVQRELLTRYHVADAASFYTGGEYWKVPTDPTQAAQPAQGQTQGQTQGQNSPDQPPYYLSIRMPGQKEPSFSLTTSFSPAGENRPYLTGFLAVDSNAGATPGKRREGYGVMRLLDVPSATNVPGPSQVQSKINTSNVSSQDFPATLNNFLNISQSGSKVQRGNLLTLPVGGGLLYVQPIYVSSRDGGTYPLLQAVVVSFGKKIAWGKTLDSALDQLFEGDSGASAGDSDRSSKGDTPAAPSPKPRSEQLKAALAEVQKLYEASQAALRQGDWSAYGKAQEALAAAISKAVQLAPEGGVAGEGGEKSSGSNSRQEAAPSASEPPTPSASVSEQE
ncbi:UPF0182 family protein [Dermatophilus congolensis]|uniref:UPF0182 family protein n=1 Tax=Dermatophilus congolensis TaxID=1863 RepID=UPI001AAFCBA4|nr:UPF0182 family protein [Dermatophilus congolensis]MBO3176906.1 UPF0182 family protein [Dermatophilus congolensis]